MLLCAYKKISCAVIGKTRIAHAPRSDSARRPTNRHTGDRDRSIDMTNLISGSAANCLLMILFLLIIFFICDLCLQSIDNNIYFWNTVLGRSEV